MILRRYFVVLVHIHQHDVAKHAVALAPLVLDLEHEAIQLGSCRVD